MGSAVSTFKENQKKSKDKKQNNTSQALNALLQTDDDQKGIEEYTKYRKGTSEIAKKDLSLEQFFIKLKSSGVEVNEKLINYIKGASAGESLRIQEWQLGRLATTAPKAYKDWFDNLPEEEKAKEAKWLQQHGNGDHYKKFFTEVYAPGFDDGLSPAAIGGLLVPEVNRASSTQK